METDNDEVVSLRHLYVTVYVTNQNIDYYKLMKKK